MILSSDAPRTLLATANEGQAEFVYKFCPGSPLHWKVKSARRLESNRKSRGGGIISYNRYL